MKNFLVVVSSCSIILGFPLSIWAHEKANSKKMKNEKIVIVPGQSLGNVKIGQTEEQVKEAGFVADESREMGLYFKRQNILVRTDSGKVTQIWFSDENRQSLVLRGKAFPKATDPKSLRKFFKNCEPEVKSTGGILIYCEGRGVELAYSYGEYPKSELQGISIVTPSAVEKVTNTPEPKKSK